MNDRIDPAEAVLAKPGEPTPAELALYEAARPSVGNIVATHSDSKGRQVMGSAGSGFFVRSSSDAPGTGLCEMVTDNHVISIDKQLKAELEVTLNDDTKHKAVILRQDPAHDLAFIKVLDATPSQCKALTLSDDPLAVGEATVRLNRTRWDPGFRTGSYQGTALRKDMELPKLEGEDMNREFLVFNTFNSTGYQFSGGPYIDMKGKVVAIQEGGQTSDYSLATPARDIKEQLDLLHKKQ